MTEELPLAKRTVNNETVTFGIWECLGDHDSIVFSVTVGLNNMNINGCGCLTEYIEIGTDRVKFGKWGSNLEILAADPLFFDKMTYMMTMVAQVVTMGWYSPEGRHAPKKVKKNAKKTKRIATS